MKVVRTRSLSCVQMEPLGLVFMGQQAGPPEARGSCAVGWGTYRKTMVPSLASFYLSHFPVENTGMISSLETSDKIIFE